MFRLALVVVVGCSSPSTPPPTKPPVTPPGAIVIDLASVSLAEDCGGGPAHLSVETSSQKRRPGPSVAQSSQAGDQACEQTTMQLKITAGAAGAIKIKRVELLDPSGKAVGELTPRAPSKWADDGYHAWDEHVEAGQDLTTSYALSAPDWSKLPGGRDPSVAYRVRVTIAVGDDERTLDKPAMIEGPALPLPEGVVT